MVCDLVSTGFDGLTVTSTSIGISNYSACGAYDDPIELVALRPLGAGVETLVRRGRMGAGPYIRRRQGERRAVDVAQLLKSIRRRAAWTLG